MSTSPRPDYSDLVELLPDVYFPLMPQADNEYHNPYLEEIHRSACLEAQGASKRVFELIHDGLRTFYPYKAAQLEDLYAAVSAQDASWIGQDISPADEYRIYSTICRTYPDFRDFVDSLASLEDEDSMREDEGEV